MAKTILWSITCGRSWLTGEPISYDEALLHHIFHDPSGKTLYGADYEKFQCLAVLKGDKENKIVENNRRNYEDLFIYMWQQFKLGEFKKATNHHLQLTKEDWQELFEALA